MEIEQIPWKEIYRSMCTLFFLPGIRHPKEEDTDTRASSGISRAAASAASRQRQLRHALPGRKDVVIAGRDLASLVLMRDGVAQRQDLVKIMYYRLDAINEDVPKVGGGFYSSTFNHCPNWQKTGKSGQWELNEDGKNAACRLLVDIICSFMP